MKVLSMFLIMCLLLPFIPGQATAQLVPGPLNSSSSDTSIMFAPKASSDLNVIQSSVSDDYRLGAGDRLEAHLIVQDNALVLDYNFVVNPEGKIFFPQVAEIFLAGLTIKQARAKMVKEIRKKYREKFDLSLMITQPKKIDIYVTGQVSSPGLRSVFDGERISSVLKSVGVAKGGSDLSEYVHLKRQTGNGEFEEYKLKLHDIFLENGGAQNMVLKNGDIIAVPSIKSYVYVYGEVSRGGTFGYVPGQTLSDYLNIAGGPTARANLGGVTVTRQENGKPKTYHIDASNILHRGVSEKDIEIIPGDVVSVPGNFFYFSDFASFANTILLALTLYTAMATRL